MLERAEWRLRPSDPRTPIGWVFGVDRWRGVPAYGMLVGIGAMTIFALALCTRLLPGRWGDVVAMTALVVVMLKMQPSVRRPEAPDPAPAACYGCVVDIKRDGRSLGEDGGILTFSEGWLVYEGRRTSFALTRAVVAEAKARDLRLCDGSTVRFSLDSTAGDALAAWVASPSTTGISRLPLDAVHPERKAMLAGWLSFCSALIFGGGLGVAVVYWGDVLDLGWMTGLVLGCASLASLLKIGSRRLGKGTAP